MMRYIIAVSLILIFFKVTGQNQKLSATVIDNYKIQADTYFGSDGLGAVYYVKNNIFFKQKNSQIWQYNNIKLGKITDIDIINPLKIVLYYQNHNTAVLLDNNLNETQVIKFNELENIIIPAKIGNASQNQIWILNSINQQIYLYNYKKKSLKPVGQPILEEIIFAQTEYNYLFWITDKNQLFSCDIFGKIKFIGIVDNWEKIMLIENDTIIFYKNNKLYYQNFTNHKTQPILVEDKRTENFYYKDQILSIFTNPELTNYKINLP